MNPIEVGHTVSHYRVVEDLGGGGMARVYRAVDVRLEREVVLKFLPPKLAHEAESRERMVREARAASALDHPNICTIFEIDQTEDGRPFIAMAYYRGETLEERLSRGPLAAAEALRIAAGVLAGLAAAHAKGIVHRDIKPANLMLTPEGRVKILDFGVAKLASATGLTKTGATVGTVAYTSPEQLEGEPVDARSDLWSVGVVLYEMLTGRHPFAGETAGAVMNAILHRQPTPPSQVRTGLSAGLDEFVARALEKDRQQRFPSAEDFRRALPVAQVSLEPTLVSAARPSRLHRRRARRSWLLPVGAATALAAIVAAVVVTRAGRRPSEDAYAIAVVPFANLTGESGQDYLAQGISASLIAQLSELVGLRVLSRSEVWSQLGEGVGARDLAAKLGIDSLLEGELQQQGDLLRASVSITDGTSGAVVWSGSFASAADQIFGLQSAIADRVAHVLEIQLSPQERERLQRDPTRSAKAYEYYLKGREALDGPEGPETLDAASTLFRQAIRLDESFALADAGLSEALWRTYHATLDRQALTEAEAAAARALQLDPQLPAAIVARARVLRSTGRQATSIEELQRVLERHPKPATAYRELADGHQQVGDLEEAESALRMAVTLDEDDWRSWIALGQLLVQLGRLEEAEGAFERAAELASDVTQPRIELATLELWQGRFEAAIAAFEALPQPVRDPRVASNMASAYYFSDRPDRLDKALEHYRLAVQLAPGLPTYRRNLADVHLELGREAEARRVYREALDLVTKELEANPTNVELQFTRIDLAARSGQCAVALASASRLRLEVPATAQALHDLAAAYALCGESDKALDALREAVRLGFSSDIIRDEAEFAGLRGLPAFEEATAPPPAAR